MKSHFNEQESYLCLKHVTPADPKRNAKGTITRIIAVSFVFSVLKMGSLQSTAYFRGKEREASKRNEETRVDGEYVFLT